MGRLLPKDIRGGLWNQMSVFLCIPSARPDGGTISEWRAMGYRIAVYRDFGQGIDADILIEGRPETYPGYARATNGLIAAALDMDCGCDWCVIGGDDISPDPSHAPEEIARECSQHFHPWLNYCCDACRHLGRPWPTGQVENLHQRSCPCQYCGRMCPTYPVKDGAGSFGAMQPTGDSWGEDELWAIRKYPAGQRRYIERICGSAWLGREFCERMYGGKGPLWTGYTHMRVDEELQEVAIKMGALWQRPDLTQYHHHAQRDRSKPIPEFLKRAYSPEHWAESSALFNQRKAAGFPGHEPL